MPRSEADQLIADLIEWGAGTGEWDAEVWKRARLYMRRVRACERSTERPDPSEQAFDGGK